MANVRKSDRVQDTDIKRLNHVGLGLKAIAEQLGCHAATVTSRLKAMGVEPLDTRRSFMEQVFTGLSQEQQDWLSHNLYNAGIDIRTFVTRLIQEAFESAPGANAPAPALMPELKSAPIPDDSLLAVEPAPTAMVQDLVVTEVLPEYVGDSLDVPLCGVCHENVVEASGQVCPGCKAVPENQPESIFGR